MFTGGRTGHDRHLGIYKKYDVKRVDDPNNKHPDCEYFVLDLTHDKYAIPALIAYANACSKEFPALATDLREITNAHYHKDEWHEKR